MHIAYILVHEIVVDRVEVRLREDMEPPVPGAYVLLGAKARELEGPVAR